MLKSVYIGGGVKRKPPERRAYECLPKKVDGNAVEKIHNILCRYIPT